MSHSQTPLSLRIITRILLTALTLLVIDAYLPGVAVEGLYPAVIAAVILGVLHAVVRPLLVILTLPISILTLGIFIFIINAFLFWFAASFIAGFSVANFWWALLGSLIVTLVSTIGNRYIR